MKKYVMFALIGLFIISLIINVELLKNNRSQTSPQEVNGAYEMFMISIQGVHLYIDEYTNAVDQNSKTISMFRLIRHTRDAKYYLDDLNRKTYEVYAETLPLRMAIFELSEDASNLAVDSVEKDISPQLQTMKKQVDPLLNILKSNNITDKESLEKTLTELNTITANDRFK